MRSQLYLAAVLVSLSLASCKSDEDPPSDTPDAPPAGMDAMVDAPPAGPSMSFFITSTGGPNGGDFRRAGMNDLDGLAGADELCRSLAAAADPAHGTKPWRAYLSTNAINAKDRIGKGPWYNQKLVKIADSVADLIDPTKNLIGATTGLDEKGGAVPGRAAGNQNRHDILTGTLANGMAAPTTCDNWTSSSDATGQGAITGMAGHFDREGGGQDPSSWSSAHSTRACSLDQFILSGGRGSIYCFVAN